MKNARLIRVVVAVGALACTRSAPPAPEQQPADAGAGSSGAPAPAAVSVSAPDGGPGSADGGTAAVAATAASAAPPTPPPRPAPSPAPLTSAAAVIAAARQPLAREQPTVIDPASSFEVELAVHLADGRLALHDEADAMVPSTGTTELADGVTRYRIVPDEPLRPGSRYSLHLDGAVTREPHGPDGVAYAPVVLQVKTSGERPAAPARKRRGSRR